MCQNCLLRRRKFERLCELWVESFKKHQYAQNVTEKLKRVLQTLIDFAAAEKQLL